MTPKRRVGESDDSLRERRRAWYLANRDKSVARQSAYNHAHREEINTRARAAHLANRDAENAQNREWKAKHPRTPEQKDRQIARWADVLRYRRRGLTKEMFEEFLDAQEGACAFCGKELPKTHSRIAIDHDHATGAYRGLVHLGCNATIGHAENEDRFVGYMGATSWAAR